MKRFRSIFLVAMIPAAMLLAAPIAARDNTTGNDSATGNESATGNAVAEEDGATGIDRTAGGEPEGDSKPAAAKPGRKRPADETSEADEEDDEEEDGPAEPEPVQLTTSDGVSITAWYYPAWTEPRKDNKPKAATPVILVHDLLGSHESIESLAFALQRKGMAVVAPDLRGHGGSRTRVLAGGKTDSIAASQLRKADLESIGVVTGGTVRGQADVRGDLEVVRAWLDERADEEGIDMSRLCVVASGLGATLAAQWVVNDWVWGERPLASGPQGRFVRGLVLVSPVWASKGVSLTPVIASPVVRGGIPLLIVSGTADRDGARLFEQLKRLQPDSWFEQRAGQDPKWAPQLAKSADAKLFSIQTPTPLSADKLLSDPAMSPAERIAGFIALVTTDGRPAKP